MKTKKVTSREIKNVNNVYNKTMLSPFKVLNWINANRKEVFEDGTTVQDVLSLRGIKKLSLNDLFNYPDAYGKDTICKLVSMQENCEYLDTIKVSGKWFKIVPVKNTINDFFKSLNTLIDIESAKERYVKMYNGLLLKQEAKEIKEANKEAKEANKKLEKDIKKMVEALKLVPLYSSFSENELREKAIEMLEAKAA